MQPDPLKMSAARQLFNPFRAVLIVMLCLVSTQARQPAFAVHRSVATAFSSTASDFTTVAFLNRIRGGSTHVLEDEEDDEDDDEDPDDEEESTEESSTPSKPSPASSAPLPITVKTNLGYKVLDQALELTVNRSRTIASVKDSLRRQLPGRPPVSAIQLVLHGQRLDDDVLLEELVDEEDEDDDDDEEDQDENAPVLVLQLDMVPPVDPKFIPQLELDMDDLTTSELLDVYATNEAAVYQNAAMMMNVNSAEPSMSNEAEEDQSEDEIDLDEPDFESTNRDSDKSKPLVTTQIREQAARLRQSLEATVLSTSNAQTLLSAAHQQAPSQIRQAQLVHSTQTRGQRVRHTAVRSVKSSLKREIQHVFNINWAESIRYFCLFLFFGYFGGRTATSRAILLLGAPSVFVLQARPVKLALKKIVYALLDHPPSILLSLLPAPQQMILSLNVAKEMDTLYGVNKASVEKQVSIDNAEDDDDEEFFSAEEDFDEEESDEEENDDESEGDEDESEEDE